MKQKFLSRIDWKRAMWRAGLRARGAPIRCVFLLASAACVALWAQPPRPQTPSKPIPMQVPPQWDIRNLIVHAEAADTPEGSKAYTRQLTEMFVSPLAGDLYIDTFAERLSTADMTARRGGGHLVPEGAIAQAFNDMMSRVHSPLRTDANVVHTLRRALYAVSPALSTVNSNNSECLPGEAVDVMTQLLMDNGTLEDPCSPSIPAEHRCVQRYNAGILIGRYIQSHSRSRNAELFDHVAKLFGM